MKIYRNYLSEYQHDQKKNPQKLYLRKKGHENPYCLKSNELNLHKIK